MKNAILASALLFASCVEVKIPEVQVEKPKTWFSSSDPFFNEIVSDFVDDCRLYMKESECEAAWDIPINFMPEEEFSAIKKDSVLAFCRTDGKSLSEIIVREKTRRLDKGRLKNLVYHEFGHSHLLKRGHRSDKAVFHDVYAQSSIMDPYSFDSSWAWEQYRRELFTSDGKEITRKMKKDYLLLRGGPKVRSAFRGTKVTRGAGGFYIKKERAMHAFLFKYDRSEGGFERRLEHKVYPLEEPGRYSEWPELVEEIGYGEAKIDPVSGFFSAAGVEWRKGERKSSSLKESHFCGNE